MDDVARLPDADRADLFAAAASRRGLTLDIMEKDFWVCWVLKRLFTLEDPPARLIFKGGTSLSKAFGAIDRFSEDVDLSFDRRDLGHGGDADPAHAASMKQRNAALKRLSATCASLLRDDYLPGLIRVFGNTLQDEDWALTVDDNDAQTLLFHYPRHKRRQHADATYVVPIVRLEFGARSDHWPADQRTIAPYAATEMPEHFQEPECEVTVLAGERTFWEKATLLHSLHHAPIGKVFQDRRSRHYYDLACLSEHEIGARAIADTDLLLKVAEHKTIYFASGWASYKTARPGTLRLLPQAERTDALEEDYKKMEEMIFGEQKPFVEVMATLRTLEDRINAV